MMKDPYPNSRELRNAILRWQYGCDRSFFAGVAAEEADRRVTNKAIDRYEAISEARLAAQGVKHV